MHYSAIQVTYTYGIVLPRVVSRCHRTTFVEHLPTNLCVYYPIYCSKYLVFLSVCLALALFLAPLPPAIIMPITLSPFILPKFKRSIPVLSLLLNHVAATSVLF